MISCSGIINDSSITTYGITNNSILSQLGSASFNSASFNSIINNGLLTTNNLELGPNGTSFTYLDLKTTGGNSDYDIRIGCQNGSSPTSGNGVLSFNCISCTINSPLTANSGTFSGITNNTNEITNNSTLSQVGTSTFTTSSTFNDNINILVGKSLYVGSTNYIRVHQSSGSSYIDYTDGLNFGNSGSTTTFTLNNSNNQGTFNYNLNTTGITNGTNAIVNNGMITHNLIANFNSNLNVTG